MLLMAFYFIVLINRDAGLFAFQYVCVNAGDVTMWVYLILNALLACSVLSEKVLRPFPKNIVQSGGMASRIFGGSVAADGQFPYMVFILYRDPSTSVSTCSASLINADKVLLAAHCFNNQQSPNPSDVLAVAGKADLGDYFKQRYNLNFSLNVNEELLGLQERRGFKISISPKFANDTYKHDVAVVTVDRPFLLNGKVQILPLATGSLVERKSCTIQGWGLAEENRRSYRLMFVSNVHALPIQDCSEKKNGPFFCLQKTHSGICKGDSGSPAVCEDQIYGVASHISARADAQCGDDLEEFFCTIQPEFDWIRPLMNYHPPQSLPNGVKNKNAAFTFHHLSTGLVMLPYLFIIPGLF